MNVPSRPMRRIPKQRGFSLIEVLISLVVLSIGLLGIAGLQTSGMRFTYTANVFGTAAMLAQNMADRMRANSNAGTSNQAGNAGGVILGYYDNLTAGGSGASCNSGACTPQQIAQMDAQQWFQMLSTLLPSGQGSVQCMTSSPNYCDNSISVSQSAYLITVCWDAGLGPPATGCGTTPGSTAYTSDPNGTYQITLLPVMPP